MSTDLLNGWQILNLNKKIFVVHGDWVTLTKRYDILIY